MKWFGWSRLLFREMAAVIGAVHEDKNRCNAVPSKPLQAPEKPISTAECSTLGNVRKNAFAVTFLSQANDTIPIEGPIAWTILLVVALIRVLLPTLREAEQEEGV